MSKLDKWKEWVDIDTVKIVSQHTTAVLAVLLSFWLVVAFLERIVGDPMLRGFIEAIESIILVGVLLWLVVQMGYLLWSRRAWRGGKANGPTVCLVVA